MPDVRTTALVAMGASLVGALTVAFAVAPTVPQSFCPPCTQPWSVPLPFGPIQNPVRYNQFQPWVFPSHSPRDRGSE